MAIKIQSGREYVTESGAKTGVLGPNRSGSAYDTGEAVLLGFVDGMERLWRLDGRHVFGEAGMDIVSEWPVPIESPIRTVTRRELVPGVYDRVEVNRLKPDAGHIMIALTGRTGSPNTPFMFTANELRSAAMILSQLAEFLDEDKGDE